MFKDCESIIEVEFNFNGYEKSKDLVIYPTAVNL